MNSTLKTNRKLWKVILLSLITFGIYPLVMMHNITTELNIVASKRDGKKTMNYILMTFVITPITFGIGMLVWMHKFSARVGEELNARNLNYSFGAGTFWGWNILGAMIGIGPLVYQYKMLKAVNMMNEDYNQKG